MTGRLRALWELSRAEGADGPARRDTVLAAVLLVAVAVEGALRTDVVWRPVAIALAVVVVLCLPWRRVAPGRCVAIAFGSIAVVQVVAIAAGAGGSVGLASSACVLLIVYAAARWGSGREIVLLGSFLVLILALGFRRDYRTVTDAVAEVVILLLPVTLGIAVRAQSSSRDQELERVRVAEREQLARELHDTVAHHVSAMVVRAQAGRVVAASRPEAAVEALRVIEEEGSRTLSEMRVLVGALRDGGGPELAPVASVHDVAGLASGSDGGPVVTVAIDGDVDHVHPSVAAAVYRIAQESVTNARRHAVGATLIEVEVRSGRDDVRLQVRDDGRGTAAAGAGYGIVGMTERAALLGGSLQAGPASSGGWLVDARLPRTGASR